MLNHNIRKSFYILLSIFMVLAQPSCSTAAQDPPPPTVIVDTATPQATSTPKDTATPDPTSTSTAIPAPTATFTPNVTATQIPEITPPAEGKGNVVGLVLWNNQPVTKAAVWLCHEFTYYGCNEYKANTDQNGYYVFTNITPGEYIVAINSFSSSWWVFYFDSNGNKLQKVTASENLVLNPWNIWKFDLNVVYPRSGKAISEAHPTLKWEAYPGASYYLLSLYDEKYNLLLEDVKVDGNEFALEDVTLVTCTYYWILNAYSAEDMRIASAPGENYFISIDLPGNC